MLLTVLKKVEREKEREKKRWAGVVRPRIFFQDQTIL